jgi:hypothetical protein
MAKTRLTKKNTGINVGYTIDGIRVPGGTGDFAPMADHGDHGAGLHRHRAGRRLHDVWQLSQLGADFTLGAVCMISLGLLVITRTASKELAGGLLNVIS